MCERTLPWLKDVCGQCALPIEPDRRLCQSCFTDPPGFQIKALFDYQKPVSQFLTQFKYHQQLYFAKLIALWFLENFTCPQVESIVPMPAHINRLKSRGFNQTLEIAKVIARHRGIPLNRFACRRIKDTPPQSGLIARERLDNIKAHYFEIDQNFKAKRVLVIEDVVTTGTTITAFCQALKAAGVEQIVVWACCRTLQS